MAPQEESIQLPALEKCLNGNSCLIPWRTAFLRLTDPSEVQEQEHLYYYLSHDETRRLLSNPFSAFPEPTAQSRAAFQTKLAAINIAPAQYGRYDVEEIKSDALCLSKEANIDELSALRIVLLEWQTRPASQLLHGFADEEITSLHDAAGISNFRSTIGGSQIADTLASIDARKANPKLFGCTKAKKTRIVETYISERLNLLKVSHQLMSAAAWYKNLGRSKLHEEDPSKYEKPDMSWLERLALPIWDMSHGKPGSVDKLLQGCIKFIEEKIGTLDRGSGFFKDDGGDLEIEALWSKSGLTEIIHMMQIMILHVQASPKITTTSVLTSWLQLMARYDYLECLHPMSDLLGDLLEPLGMLAATTSLSLLKLSQSMELLQDPPSEAPKNANDTPYFLDLAAIGQINETFLELAESCLRTASPAVFAWGTILHTLRDLAMESRDARELRQSQLAIDSFNASGPASSASRSHEHSIYEDLFEKCNIEHSDSDDPVDTLIRSAVDGSHVLNIAAILAESATSIVGLSNDHMTGLWIEVLLLDLLRNGTSFLGYLPELMVATLATLSGTKDILEGLGSPASDQMVDARRIFLHDELLMEQLLCVAKNRFPYEAVPFLKLCQTLATCDEVDDDGLPLIFEHLEKMETYTQILPSDFQGYQTIREDENANYVSLLEPVRMQDFSSRNTPQMHQSSSKALMKHDALELPAGTVGQIISETRPAVVLWHSEYSCLNFLGRWLHSGRHVGEPSLEITAEIMGLFANLLATVTRNSKKSEALAAASRILGDASDGLDRGEDIVALIFDKLEDSLQISNLRAGPERSLDLITAGLHFVEALIPVAPGRVWPYLSRSSLLGVKGEGGLLAHIVSAIEVPSGDFPFLLASVKIFEALVEDAVSQAVTRKAPSENSTRFAASSDTGSGVPTHSMSRTLTVFGNIMTEVYETSTNWRFNSLEQKLTISNTLASSFANTLYFVYGVDDTESSSAKLNGVLSDLAAQIVRVFRSATSDDLPFNPVLRIIMDGLNTPTSTLFVKPSILWAVQVQRTLRLATLLIQIGGHLEMDPSLFEDQMFKATPTLVRLYVTHESYRLPVISLLDILIRKAASTSTAEPPSLLGHLGPETSCHFLDILSYLDRPLNDPALYAAIWNFLATLVSKRQQWFAIFLLTGSSPRHSMSKKNPEEKLSSRRGKASLVVALDLLADISNTDPRITISMLNFVARAQENFPWATTDLQKHPTFFTSILNYVANLGDSKEDTLQRCDQLQIAALVADLAAVYLHFSDDAREMKFIQKLILPIKWYANNAVDVSAYNTSLHANLKKNFAARYKGCQLVNFKRTGLTRRSLGQDYFYDLTIGKKLLDHDSGWTGKTGNGFADELARANVNLSVVEAQINLLQSWKFFAIEHCSYFMSDREIQKSMAVVVEQCLKTNAQDLPQEAIFDQLAEVRVEFAMALLQRLNDIKARGSEVFSLLFTAWDAMRSRQRSYETALANDDVAYYRSLLNVLFLTLQFHVSDAVRDLKSSLQGKKNLPSDTPTILEILDVVVAQGFRSLTTYLHDDSSKCCPKDFAILTAILQTCLQTRNIDQLHEAIVKKFIENNTSRYATALFSWSDKLMVNGDPIYGELSILFLLELSTIPIMAEHLAIEGILTNLSTSRLMNFYLHGPSGYNPLDGVPRPFIIWTNGILPLCLNILHHVGRTAPEVAAFLNQFGPQLARASNSFASKYTVSAAHPYTGGISLAMASEAQSLALISFILDKFRAAGPSMGIDPSELEQLSWDRVRVKEDIEELLSRRQVLRSRIVATSEKEVGLKQKMRQGKNGSAENALEVLVVKELQGALMCLGGGEGAAE